MKTSMMILSGRKKKASSENQYDDTIQIAKTQSWNSNTISWTKANICSAKRKQDFKQKFPSVLWKVFLLN